MSEKQSLYTKLILCLQRLAGTEHLTKWMRKLGEKSYLLHSPGSSTHTDLHQTFTSQSSYFCLWKGQTGARKSWGVWAIATNCTGGNTLHAKSRKRIIELICFPKNEYERIVTTMEKRWHRLVLLLFSKVLSPFRLWIWSASRWIQWQFQFWEFPPHPDPSTHSSSTLPSFLLPPSTKPSPLCQHHWSKGWALSPFLTDLFPNTEYVHIVLAQSGAFALNRRGAGRHGAEKPNYLRGHCPIAVVSWKCSFSNSALPFHVYCWWNPTWVK